jgi:CO/xanthine dehydrogenase Mo-binding subunit
VASGGEAFEVLYDPIDAERIRLAAKRLGMTPEELIVKLTISEFDQVLRQLLAEDRLRPELDEGAQRPS